LGCGRLRGEKHNNRNNQEGAGAFAEALVPAPAKMEKVGKL
jgi:hypothetical protein